jgi:hypothetical protein
MFNNARHSSKVFSRRTLASMITFMYLLILLTPFTLYSKVVAQAFTGECTGNCTIDGCSRKSRAGHSCCCAQKKQTDAGKQKFTEPTDKAVAEVKPSNSGRSSCCTQDSSPHRHDKRKLATAPHSEKRPKDPVVITCCSPCGKEKLHLFSVAGSSEILPYIYAERLISPSHEATRYTLLTRRMTSRHAEPPDPPPRQHASS